MINWKRSSPTVTFQHLSGGNEENHLVKIYEKMGAEIGAFVHYVGDPPVFLEHDYIS
jgi:hypothetical protein